MGGYIPQHNLTRIHALIANHAPINRWRSLYYVHSEQSSYCTAQAIAPTGEGFDSLESLNVQEDRLDSTVVHLLERTALKLWRLRVKDHRHNGKIDALEDTRNPVPVGIRPRITSLRYYGKWTTGGLRGFNNITHFAYNPPKISSIQRFPEIYLKDLYRLSIMLTNLVSLEAHLSPDSQMSSLNIDFPNLRHLVIGWGSGFPVTSFPSIWATLLERLDIRPYGEESGREMVDNLQALFLTVPIDYRLVPRTLNLCIPMELDKICIVLDHNPLVQHLKITVDRLESVPYSTVASLFTKRTTSVAGTVEWRYCPSLITLHILLDWSSGDMSDWVHYAREIVKSRGGDGFLKVCVNWKDSQEIEIHLKDV